MNRFAICNETFGDWPLERALDYAASLGYTGWEVAPFMLSTDARTITSAERTRYRSAVEAAGLQVLGLHWLLAKTEGFHLTTDDRQVRMKTTAYFESLIQLCADLGGTVMVMGSPLQRNLADGQTREQADKNAASVLGSLNNRLQQSGVKIALEPLGPQETNYLNTADQARALRDRVGSDQIGLHLDVKAMSAEPEPVTQIIRNHADWLIHFHANDPNRQGPGMGEVDFGPIMQTLNEVGYQNWISVEVFDYSPGIETLATKSIQTLKRYT